VAKAKNKKALNAIFAGKWAIETNHLDIMIGIADRTYSNMEAVLTTPTERRQSGAVNVRDGVAVINVFGPIFPHADLFTDISGATSVETLALRFGEALNAPDVKAIVLNVDSPGGNIVGINEFAKKIYEARGKKPIVAYTGGYCASAAYWIASAADRIVADDTAFLGSIGVVAAWTDDSEARKKQGIIDYEVVSSQSPDKRQDPNSAEGRAKLQAELDALADIFLESVARNRNSKPKQVSEKFGKGGILITEEAIRVGMADEVGSLEGVIAELSEAIPVLAIKAAQVATGSGEYGARQNKKFLELVNLTTPKKGATDMSAAKKEDEEESKAKSKAKSEDEDLDKEDEDEDEEEEESKAKSKPKAKDGETSLTLQMATVQSENPALFNAIKQVGANEERERIKAIDDVAASAGYTSLVRKAMFETPMTAGDLALQIIKTDNAAIQKAATDYQEDAKEADDVPACVSDNDKNADAMVSAMVSGFKAVGGKEVKRV